MNLKLLASVVVAACLSVSSAQADIVYVNADLTNTLVGGAPGVVGNAGDPGVNLANARANDDLWAYTVETASTGGTNEIFSGRPADSGLPALTTTVTGLAAGQYETYAFFRDPSVWLHDASAAGSVSGSTPTSTGQVNMAGTDSTTLMFNGAGPSTGGNITSYGVLLGTVEVGADGEIVWTINNPGAGDRTWYEGVGFEAVAIPEPSSLAALALIGGGMMSRRRRRK